MTINFVFFHEKEPSLIPVMEVINEAEKELTEVERIFSDAHIVDIDFSEWDQKITFCVLADHFRDWYGTTNRCPTLLVDFKNVTRFNIEFNHKAQGSLGAGEHYQCLIDSPEIEGFEGNWVVKLSGSLLAAPVIKLACEQIHFEEIEPKVLDRLFPGWNKPSSGFVRPGIVNTFRKREKLG